MAEFSFGFCEDCLLQLNARLNCKISLIGSILSVKNESSCKNGGLKRIMFGPSHAHLLYVAFFFYTVCPKKVTRVLN